MKSNRVFFLYLAFGLEIILLWTLQSTPKLLPELFGAKPFFLLAAALSFSVCVKTAPAVILGAVCGLLADISSGGTVGYFAFAFTVVCFAQAQLLDAYINRNLLSATVLSLGSTAAVMGLHFLIFYIFGGIADSSALFVSRWLPRMAWTAAAFFPLLLINRFLARTFTSRTNY